MSCTMKFGKKILLPVWQKEIRLKYVCKSIPTNCDAYLAESLFQIRFKLLDCQQKRCQKKQKQYLCYPFQCCQVWNLYCSEA